MKNLVIGVAENYTLQQLSPFVLSLRQTSFSGDIVLFVRNLSNEVLSFLKTHRVQTIPYSYKEFWGEDTIRRVINWSNREGQAILPGVLQARLIPLLWHINARRYLLYQDFFQKTRDEYGTVLLADVGDVVFQSDPFVQCQEKRLYMSSEYPAKTIGSSKHNRRWILESFGLEAVHELADHPIICSGVILGPADLIAQYIYLMVFYLTSRLGHLGYDQGVHNYIVYKCLISPVCIMPFGYGPILHMATYPPSGSDFSLQLPVLNEEGHLFAIVHQYDRHPYLEAEIRQKYAALE